MLNPKPALAGELGRPGTAFPLVMPAPWADAEPPAPVREGSASSSSSAAPPRLCLYATIAPLLPLAECAEPGRFEAVVDAVAAAGYAGIEAQVSQILLIGALGTQRKFFCTPACPSPFSRTAGKERFAATLTRAGFRFIGKIYSSGSPAAVPRDAGIASHPAQGLGVAAHLAVWEASLRECVSTPELRALLTSVSSQVGGMG